MDKTPLVSKLLLDAERKRTEKSLWDEEIDRLLQATDGKTVIMWGRQYGKSEAMRKLREMLGA